MILSKEQAEELQAFADKYPDEEISAILVRNKQTGKPEIIYLPVDNIQRYKALFRTHEYVDSVREGTLLALVHSHPSHNKLEFSKSDMDQMQYCSEPWILFLAGNQERTYLYFGGVDYANPNVWTSSEEISGVVRCEY
ncbi:hypothetical protein CKF54_00505 [Psittacicella hinzii]|uniref:JAB domain-containing protein n=1 Tax=Psittacicella hinzii TaxID=2028575 RepID=A0A3A1YAE2_9GAMM|nr:Mov34/MPN/PAD-1 family protein [Psittacicella hinzii]RIY34511.1 hypothetical protein CKF54_00505 [Psittacicella hinzii]